MRSGKSWFNLTLYKKNLTRFWPIWGLYLAIWLFAFPINLILENYGNVGFAHREVLDALSEAGLIMALLFSLMAACAVWSFLYNNRSAGLMHTLPIRREGLFATNWLSGMTFLVGPNLIVYVLTLLAELAVGEVDAGALLVWLAGLTLMELFFFSFATFCAMFTGHMLGLPAFYAILNGLAAGLAALIQLTLSRFLFGYTGGGVLWGVAKWLTPVWMLEENLRVQGDVVDGELMIRTCRLAGFEYIAIYAVAGLVLTGLALLLYRRRHMERAGDVVTVAWMRPVFQYGVAFCCALAFGTLLFEMFRYSLSDGAWTLLFFMLICGAVGYFAARMILEKSFRVFRCWKGCLPFLAVLVVLTCALEFDLTGFERRVPDQAEVESVDIWDLQTAPYDESSYTPMNSTDPELVQAVLALHRAIVENKGAIESDGGGWYQQEETPQGYFVQTKGYSGFDIVYTLKDGSKISRDYSNAIPISAEDFSDPDSPTALMDALVNLPQAVEEAYGLSDESAEDIIDMTLSSYYVGEDYDAYEDVAVSKQAYEKVFRAVMADFAEGNLGRRYLMDDEQRMENCFVNDLEITFYRGVASEEVYSDSEAGSIVISEDYGVPWAVDTPGAAEAAMVTERITVTLQATARHTLAALRELGALEGQVNLFTQAQMDLVNRRWEQNGGSWTGVDLEALAWDVLGG